MSKKIVVKCFVAIVVLVLSATVAQAKINIDIVLVGDMGNAGELSGVGAGGYGTNRICGAVDYAYGIGKYEVTNSQYSEFLNAVADTDPNDLYKTSMAGGWNDVGGIIRSGSPGNYTYTTRTGRANRPVNHVSWYDTLRFTNWLHNGQPTGLQDSSTTENGAYDMSLGSNVVRKPGAQFFLPTEDEWYKAAYYKGGSTNAGYWDYPTQSDSPPTAELPAGSNSVNGSANFRNPGHVDTTYHTTEVGAYTAKPSDSAYGTFDQGGNQWEWNEALIGSYRGARGGCFDNTYAYLNSSFRCEGGPTNYDHGSGFRVARAVVPEPSTLALLVMGAVGFLACSRQRKR